METALKAVIAVVLVGGVFFGGMHVGAVVEEANADPMDLVTDCGQCKQTLEACMDVNDEALRRLYRCLEAGGSDQ